MGWVSIVLWVLMHAGDLIGLVKQLLSLIHTLPHGDQAAMRAEVGDAVKAGDKHGLRAIMEKWRNRCSMSGGVGCGGDLVK